MGLSSGDLIDQKYRIVRLLGEGGMGVVYEGENVRIRHRVAIKVLHASVAANQEVVDRFEREAQAAGQIGSEHIVEVLDLGALANGERYMVMEFLDGESLAARIGTRGRMTAAELIPITLQLLDGLGAAHDAGIVHRDLKPENVFLLRSRGGTRDFVKILDFGISKFAAAADNRTGVTRTGSVMGTPTYMSPEHARGLRDIDHRTDLYAVGVMLYECLTGEIPFDGENPNQVLFKVVLDDAPSLSTLLPGLDPTFIKIVEKAMARERDKRFQNAYEFQQALIECALASGISLVPGPASLPDARISLVNITGIPVTLPVPRISDSSAPTLAAAPSATPPEPSPAAVSPPVTDPALPTGRATAGSWAPVVVGSARRVPPPVLAAIGLAVVLLIGMLVALRPSHAEPEAELAAPKEAAREVAPAAEPPAPHVVPSVAPAPSTVASSAPKKKPKLRWVTPPPAAPAAAKPPAKPPSVSGRKIHTEL
jgi:eukaryotic-like serine/threonine-protein kinase